MTKRIFSNKALAIVLVLAVLMSCMVFSFGGASAAEDKLMWENDFDIGTGNNWLALIQQSDKAWASNTNTNKAVYDDSNKAMSLQFIGDNSRNYLTGFTVFHKEATNANAGEYGYHGGEGNSTLTQKGMFLPAKGTYKVTFDYKVESFSATAGAAADICVGFATRGNWKWWSDSQRTNFINATNKGVYSVAATVNASTANTWQSAAVIIDQSADVTMLPHIFAFNHDGADKNLDGTTILIDNIKVYESEAPTTVKMWQNSFVAADGVAGDNGNWMGAAGRSDDFWCATHAKSGISATYDSTNEAMKLSFTTDASKDKIGGFVVCHEDTVTSGTGYGSVGVGQDESNQVKKYGVFHPAQGTYTVSLDYKVTEFTDVEGAAIDICVGFARRGSWNWTSSSSTINSFVNSNATYRGVYQAIATVKASDRGADWRTATITIDQPYNDTEKGMLLNVFVRSTHNVTDKNLNGSTVLIDNVKVYSTDVALDQSANDRYHYLYQGNVGTEEEPIYTNLHTNINNPEDPNPYTSIRIGMRYMAGDDTGKTIIIDGKEYEIVERGILVGKANSTINIGNYKWKSGKSTDLGNYWKHESVSGGHRISYTLRLANMGEAWFNDPTSYQCRSYYKIKVPVLDAGGQLGEEVFTVYGGVSGTFTFGFLAGTFTKSYWFSDIAS